MSLREILPGVFTWPWFSKRHGYDFNGYLLRHSGGNVAVDPVELPDDVLLELQQQGVQRIVLTNRNHYRAAATLRERTGARVLVHPADAEFVRQNGVAVDDALAVGDSVAGFTVVDAHGKSPGEIALWNGEVLLVGDACVGSPPGALKLLPEKVIDDLPALRASLRRLSELPVQSILVGDGAPVLQAGAAALRDLVRSFPP
jgi:glyoxylase-like metal-dependent hydrolase (beta-lactamase superfamily II)